MTEFVFAWIAGLLTIINPCILPVLPIVMGASLKAGPKGPLALTAGLCATFVVAGMGVTAFGASIGLYEEDVQAFSAIMMMLFGAILLVPQASKIFSAATAGFSARMDGTIASVDDNRYGGQVVTGMLLGLVWSPCIGPTLGGAIALAAQGQALGRAALIMLFFAFGVGTVTLLLGYGTRDLVRRRQASFRQLAEYARPVMAVILILVGLVLYMRWHHFIEAWLLMILPSWLVDASVYF